jgi:hypothetical protein
MKIAIGLAVPAMEAWYLAGVDPHVNENTWSRKLLGEQITYTKPSLKQSVYGTVSPSIGLETTRACEAANRLVGDLTLIEQLFPRGFGTLAKALREW